MTDSSSTPTSAPDAAAALWAECDEAVKSTDNFLEEASECGVPALAYVVSKCFPAFVRIFQGVGAAVGPSGSNDDANWADELCDMLLKAIGKAIENLEYSLNHAEHRGTLTQWWPDLQDQVADLEEVSQEIVRGELLETFTDHLATLKAFLKSNRPDEEEIWVNGDLVDSELSFAKVFEEFQELSTMARFSDEQKRQFVGLSSELLLSACTELSVDPEHVNIDWQELYSLISRPTFLSMGPSDPAFFHGRGSRPGVFAFKRKLGGEPSPGEKQKALEALQHETVQASTGKRRAAGPASGSEAGMKRSAKLRKRKRAKRDQRREAKVAEALGIVLERREERRGRHPDRMGPEGLPPLDQLVSRQQADNDIERMRFEAGVLRSKDPITGDYAYDVEAMVHATEDIPFSFLLGWRFELQETLRQFAPLYVKLYRTRDRSDYRNYEEPDPHAPPADPAALAAEMAAAAEAARRALRDQQALCDAAPSSARLKELRLRAFAAKYAAALRLRAVLLAAPAPPRAALRAALVARFDVWLAYERANNAVDRYALARLLSGAPGMLEAQTRIMKRELNMEMWQAMLAELVRPDGAAAPAPAPGAGGEEEEEASSSSLPGAEAEDAVAPGPAPAVAGPGKSARYSGKILTDPRFAAPESRAARNSQHKGQQGTDTFAAGGPPGHGELPLESNWDRLRHMIIHTYWRCLKAYECGL